MAENPAKIQNQRYVNVSIGCCNVEEMLVGDSRKRHREVECVGQCGKERATCSLCSVERLVDVCPYEVGIEWHTLEERLQQVGLDLM